MVACGATIWHIWLEPADPLLTFRIAVVLALLVIVVRAPGSDRSSAIPGGVVSLVTVAGIFWMPAAVFSVAWIAWRRIERWPAVVMALLALPWDPWIAASVQWPLQVVTAELGGALAGIDPSYELNHALHGDTVYLKIPCASFCDIAHHNVAAGQVGYEPLRINEQCAGLNQVEGLFALTGAILLLLGTGLSWRHDLIFLAAAPVLAVVVNGVRVALSVWIGRWVARGPWDGWVHDAPGYVVFAIAVFGMAVIARRLAERRA